MSIQSTLVFTFVVGKKVVGTRTIEARVNTDHNRVWEALEWAEKASNRKATVYIHGAINMRREVITDKTLNFIGSELTAITAP